MRDHIPLEAPAYNGLFVRGKMENCPADHFPDMLNIMYHGEDIGSRDGFALDITFAGQIKRMYLYRRMNEVTRIIFLTTGGALYDSTNLVTPILTVVGMTDFSMTVLFNKCYITPHNGITGLTGEIVYTYDGTTARPAAGAAVPEAPTLVAADSLDAGKWEAGTHVFGVAFETSSGFITKPGAFVALTNAGEKKVDLSSIPLGPVGTIARHIIATKTIEDYKGDANNQEFYFVPEGTIGDNTTTILTVNAYDSDLFDSADYLLNQLSEIPAGVGIGVYLDAIITWGEADNPNIVRRSYAGEPEAFDEIEGYISVTPNDGGGTIKNCLVLRDQLYILKEFRVYVTTDTGENPSFWSLSKVDSAFGAYPHSIVGIFEPGENIVYDQALIANPAGLWSFNGTFPPIPTSYKISDLWQRINKAYFHIVQIYFDPYGDRLYISVPLDSSTSCNYLLIADTEKGMDAESIRWLGVWTVTGKSFTSILVDINSTTKKSEFKFGSELENIYKLEEGRRNDFGQAFWSFIRFPYASAAEGENHFGMVRLRVVGSGSLDILLSSLDDEETLTPAPLTLASTKKFSLQRTFNFVTEKCSVRLGVDAINEWFKLSSAKLYANLLGDERPQ